MLESLHLENVGPARDVRMELAPRLNVITGDNGLGKTLLLDCMWYALTRTWPLTWGGKGVVPDRAGATIEWIERRREDRIAAAAQYDFGESVWKRTEANPVATTTAARKQSREEAGLVVYLRVDGGISVHDPLRVGEDFRLPHAQRAFGTSNAFQFGEREIWDGLELGGEKTNRVCEGLVRDVVRWAVEPRSSEFERLAELVERLAGTEHFRLTRKVGRVYVDDARDFPFVTGPAGELPIAHAPAGLRRILGLAYLVVWAWREHSVAAALKKREPNTSLLLLVDEVESHLHPKWQRTILPSLLHALGKHAQLQIVATTHSPMVLASIEPTFEPAQDAWFDLDVDGKHRTALLRQREFVRHGDVSNWLTSEAFDLGAARSLEAERAIGKAQAILRAERPRKDAILAVDNELRAAGLPDIDPFWVRWGHFVETKTANGKPKRKAKR